MSPQPAWVVAFRWIAFLPAAVLGAWVLWILVTLLSRWSLGWVGVESGSFVDQVFQATTAHAILGLAFVVIGAKVAPGHRRAVVYVLAGIAVLGCGWLLFPAVITRNGWAIVGAIFTALGACGALYSVQHDEGFRRDFFASDPEIGVASFDRGDDL